MKTTGKISALPSLWQTYQGSSRKRKNLVSHSWNRKSELMGTFWGMWLWHCEQVTCLYIIMTAREWYTRKNAVPMGPSCYAVCAQDELRTLPQSDKTGFLLRKCHNCKCHNALTKALSCFRNDFHLSWEGAQTQEPQGEVPCCKASESRFILQGRKIKNVPLMILSANM